MSRWSMSSMWLVLSMSSISATSVSDMWPLLTIPDTTADMTSDHTRGLIMTDQEEHWSGSHDRLETHITATILSIYSLDTNCSASVNNIFPSLKRQ